MKPAMYIFYVLGLLATIACFVSVPGWEPVAAFLIVISTLIGTLVMNKKGLLGRGGNAIVAGENAAVDLRNDEGGTVIAGKGGTGGSGGDAVYVDPGVKIKIINRGVIAGGDAGGSNPKDRSGA
jgi:hypothetical protein